MKEKIEDIYHSIVRFFLNIKRMIKWFPIIWKTREYDYRYALDVFSFQLEQIKNYLESEKAHTLHAKDHASRIKTCIELMAKVYDQDYFDEHYRKIVSLYGNYTWNFESDSGFLEKIWEKPYTKEELKQIEYETSVLFMESCKKQKRAHKILWKFIEHNIMNWWD